MPPGSVETKSRGRVGGVVMSNTTLLSPPSPTVSPRIGYLLRMYPRFSQTFVVNEILDFMVPGAAAVAVRHQDTFRTVMFTDVEASTQLVDRLGDTAARDILRRQETVGRPRFGLRST